MSEPEIFSVGKCFFEHSYKSSLVSEDNVEVDFIDRYVYLGHNGTCFFVGYRQLMGSQLRDKFSETYTLAAPFSGTPVEVDIKGHRFIVHSVSNTGISVVCPEPEREPEPSTPD